MAKYNATTIANTNSTSTSNNHKHKSSSIQFPCTISKNKVPGQQVAVNFHQLYPSNRGHCCLKKKVLSYVFQVQHSFPLLASRRVRQCYACPQHMPFFRVSFTHISFDSSEHLIDFSQKDRLVFKKRHYQQC